jgi:ketosteroid isomerase-like protein
MSRWMVSSAAILLYPLLIGSRFCNPVRPRPRTTPLETETMTPVMTSVELVQSLYEAFGRGDLEFILARVATDCRWIAPGEGIPHAGVYTGPAGAAEFFRKIAESETITRFEPLEFFTKDDDVVALGYEECRSKQTGKTAATNWAMLFRVRGGQVVHFEIFYDTAAYLRAHQ